MSTLSPGPSPKSEHSAPALSLASVQPQQRPPGRSPGGGGLSKRCSRDRDLGLGRAGSGQARAQRVSCQRLGASLDNLPHLPVRTAPRQAEAAGCRLGASRGCQVGQPLRRRRLQLARLGESITPGILLRELILCPWPQQFWQRDCGTAWQRSLLALDAVRAALRCDGRKWVGAAGHLNRISLRLVSAALACRASPASQKLSMVQQGLPTQPQRLSHLCVVTQLSRLSSTLSQAAICSATFGNSTTELLLANRHAQLWVVQ